MRLPGYVKHIDTFIAAIAAYYIIQLFTAYSGTGISPDSIMYASTAESIYKNGNLITFNGTPMVFFPVLYPAFLGISIVFGSAPVAASPVLNGLLFAAVVFTCGIIISRFKSPSVIYKWLILATLLLSPALLEIYTYLWSETLFIFIILLFIISLKKYFDKTTLGTLLLAALLAALACLTRYAGVAVVAAGGLLILFNTTLAWRKRIIHAFIFGIASVSLLAGNLLINYLSAGLATGQRKPSLTSFGQNLHYFGMVLCKWLGLTQQSYPFGLAIALLILVLLSVWVVRAATKSHFNRYEVIFTAFAVIYSLFMLITATVSRFEPLNNRLLSPMYIALLIGCTAWVPPLLSRLNKRARIWLAFVPIIIMTGFLFNLLLIDLKRYDDEFEYGVPGYSDDDWNQSEFISFLKQHPGIYKKDIPVYSDADEVVYFFTGSHARLVPHRYFKNKVAQFYGQQHYYLVWFNALAHPELVGLEDIKKHHRLKPLYLFDEGAVYEVWNKE